MEINNFGYLYFNNTMFRSNICEYEFLDMLRDEFKMSLIKRNEIVYYISNELPKYLKQISNKYNDWYSLESITKLYYYSDMALNNIRKEGSKKEYNYSKHCFDYLKKYYSIREQ